MEGREDEGAVEEGAWLDDELEALGADEGVATEIDVVETNGTTGGSCSSVSAESTTIELPPVALEHADLPGASSNAEVPLGDGNDDDDDEYALLSGILHKEPSVTEAPSQALGIRRLEPQISAQDSTRMQSSLSALAAAGGSKSRSKLGVASGSKGVARLTFAAALVLAMIGLFSVGSGSGDVRKVRSFPQDLRIPEIQLPAVSDDDEDAGVRHPHLVNGTVAKRGSVEVRFSSHEEVINMSDASAMALMAEDLTEDEGIEADDGSRGREARGKMRKGGELR